MSVRSNVVPVLMYHEVAERPVAGFEKYTVTRRAFAAQMRWLASTGYRTIDLDALLAHYRDAAPIPSRSIVITFDDAFSDCASIAGPIMTTHGFTATFFLVAGLMGGVSDWLVRERGIARRILSWDDARTLERAGHRCESHTVTHARLTEVSRDACREELTRSRRMIEDVLGHEVHHLAYPFGAHNETVMAMAGTCGYESACTVQMGISSADDSPLALRRVPVLGTDSLLDFISRLETAHTVGDRLAAFARSITGRGTASRHAHG